MTVYERIENLRNSKKLSQGKLEKELGFSNGSISKWKNSMPTPERLQKIADYFGVSMEYLMTGAEKEEEKHPELSNVYFSLAKEAEQNGIDPRDIKMAIDMLKKIREEERKKREEQGRKEIE